MGEGPTAAPADEELRGDGRVAVVVLEDDDDLREALRELLEVVAGCSCVGVASVEQLVARRDEVLGSRLAVLDIHLGTDVPSGLEAYEWLREQGFAGEVVFLTGHAREHPLVKRAHALGRATILEKPIEARELARLVAEAIA